MTARIVVKTNICKSVAARFPQEVDRIVRAQLLQTEADVKEAVVEYDVIDLGNLLGMVGSTPTGQAQGEVYSAAEYSAYQNFGTRFIGGRPFFSEPIETARTEFPERFRELERRLA